MRSCSSHLSNKNVLSFFRNESKLKDGSFILAGWKIHLKLVYEFNNQTTRKPWISQSTHPGILDSVWVLYKVSISLFPLWQTQNQLHDSFRGSSIRKYQFTIFTLHYKVIIQTLLSLLQGRHLRRAGGPSPPPKEKEKKKEKKKREKKEKKKERKKERSELWITSNYYI